MRRLIHWLFRNIFFDYYDQGFLEGFEEGYWHYHFTHKRKKKQEKKRRLRALKRKRLKLKRRDKLRIYYRDAMTCQYCHRMLGQDEFTVDHLTPLSRGGSHDPYNLVTCCKTCNAEKGNQTAQEFRRRSVFVVDS